ncbi:MAG: YbhB/YbcL family Raf kinase inhibitor-like protein [Planctomycetota bacterium]
MKLESQSFADGQAIPPEFAFARPAPEGHVTFAGNRSPHLAWSDVPAETRSFALVCVDHDAPAVGDDVNREDRTVPHDTERAEFYHWGIVDLSAELRELPAGACGEGVVPRGKSDPPGPPGTRQARQDYTSWFEGDEAMEGTYHGYDGPAPPWNDERVHNYHFTLYALDVERLPLPEDFHPTDILSEITGHVLAEATLTGTYTQNVALAEGTG